jgi:hypothetical protein
VHTGSVERRSKQLGVQLEELKLPPILQFAAGASVSWGRSAQGGAGLICVRGFAQ